MARDAKREPFEQLYGSSRSGSSKLEQGGLSLEDSIALYEEGHDARARVPGATRRGRAEDHEAARVLRALSPQRNGATSHDEPVADYEYVDEDAEPVDDDEPFA